MSGYLGQAPIQYDYDQLRTLEADLRRIAGVQYIPVTSNTTLGLADAGLIGIDASVGDLRITLPAAALQAGLPYQLVRTDTSNYTVTITSASGDNIEGSASIALSPSDRVTIVADGGTNWRASWSISTPSVAPGFVGWFSNSSAPAGYLKANGASVSRSAYDSLYQAIGTTFGAGDGSTTFNLPDLRGEFIRGWDDGRGVDSGRGLGSWQADEFKDHTHSIAARQGNFSYGSYHCFEQGSGFSTGSTGGSETRPRNVALLACIKY